MQRRVAGGDMQARAEPTGSSEQIELANAFNDMTDRLGRTLDAQQDFVANASHQLRTPLTGLRLRLEAASMKTTDPNLRKDLVAGERETERLAKLLADLLRLAQDGQRPAGTRVGLRAAARRAVERWQDQAERDDHELEIAGPDEVEVEVAAAAGDLDTILDNLIENALNYAEPGTAVRLEWGHDPDGAYLAVLDRGPGIADGEAKRVFDRFYRGHMTHAVPGTGLGLAIVETLARRWDGQASLVSRPGGGARAEVRFPLLRPAAARRSTLAVPTVGP